MWNYEVIGFWKNWLYERKYSVDVENVVYVGIFLVLWDVWEWFNF